MTCPLFISYHFNIGLADPNVVMYPKTQNESQLPKTSTKICMFSFQLRQTLRRAPVNLLSPILMTHKTPFRSSRFRCPDGRRPRYHHTEHTGTRYQRRDLPGIRFDMPTHSLPARCCRCATAAATPQFAAGPQPKSLGRLVLTYLPKCDLCHSHTAPTCV